MLLMKPVRRTKLSLRAMDAVLFVRTKSVNPETSLRNARQLSAAELRDIDIEEVSIVRAAYFDKIRT